jgi:hypothetical protein
LTLFAGIGVILAVETMLLLDVRLRGGGLVPRSVLPTPDGALEAIARWSAVNMTPIAWIGYLLIADGLLTRLAWRRGGDDADGTGGSPVRRRPRRFALCMLASVPIWLLFDWINFSFVHAWQYHGLPVSLAARWAGYFVSFAAICPGMFLAAELFQQLGLARLRGPRQPIGDKVIATVILIGLVYAAIPFVLRDPAANLTLWVAPVLILDPLNLAIGAPSLLGDWREGRYGRTVSLMLGGLLCGLLWEFWNYWAAAKWTYDLPFLGPLESIRYFEMPVLGLLGFLPFAPSCWVMFQTIAVLAARLGLPPEPLPATTTVL